MKRLICKLLLLSCIISCNSDDTNSDEEITLGVWRLVEQMADPGDGSGRFVPVRSEKTLQFLKNGSVVTNGSLCDPYSNEQIASATYSLETGEINTNCSNENIQTIFFELKDGELILNFISIEGFTQKFKRFF
ncbi:hypothetical protein ACJD0Z_00705 [Flavobacteriaceae bacterium M23B6Z8]